MKGTGGKWEFIKGIYSLLPMAVPGTVGGWLDKGWGLGQLCIPQCITSLAVEIEGDSSR